MIGCTILRAVSGILLTHHDRRGSGLGRHLAGTNAPGRAGATALNTASSALATGLCGYSPGLCGLALRPCGLPLSSNLAVWLTSLTCQWPAPRPCGLPLRPCGSPLSHLAGVGQCPPAIGHGCLVGLLVGVLDRRPVSPLPSTSACSGAGSGWHGCGWIADSAVYSEGLAPVVPGRHRVADRQRRAASPVSEIPD